MNYLAAVVVCSLGLLVSLEAAAYDVTLTDPAGDDHGPGSYLYPLDAVFTPGSFDITQVRVREVGAKVRLEVSLDGEITDPWGSGAGFSLQSIDIYVDTDGVSGSGSTWSLERRNVDFAASSAWEYCVWLAPPLLMASTQSRQDAPTLPAARACPSRSRWRLTPTRLFGGSTWCCSSTPIRTSSLTAGWAIWPATRACFRL